MEHSQFFKLKAELTAGDTQGLATIFQQHSSFCISNLQYQHQCPQQDAEDIYIDAILSFREKVVTGRIEAVADLRAYLFGTCKNMLMANVRRAKRINGVATEMGDLSFETDDNQEPASDYKETLLTITEQALEATPDPCRQMLVMFYFDKLSLEQIAAHLGFANANVAKASKSRCFKKLIELVRDLQLKKSSYEKVNGQ